MQIFFTSPFRPSILKIIVHSRRLILRHTLLPPIHLSNLPTRRSIHSLLIIPHADEARESQTNTLLTRGVDALFATGLVARAEGQVSRFDLPDVAGLEPDVGLVLRSRGVGVEGFGALDNDFRELGVEVLEDLLGEAGADVANCFVGVGEGVVAGEEEGTVD